MLNNLKFASMEPVIASVVILLASTSSHTQGSFMRTIIGTGLKVGKACKKGSNSVEGVVSIFEKTEASREKANEAQPRDDGQTFMTE